MHKIISCVNIYSLLCHGTSQQSADKFIGCLTVHYHNGQCTSILVVLCYWTSPRSVHTFIGCVASLDITSVFVTGHHKFIGYVMPWFDW